MNKKIKDIFRGILSFLGIYAGLKYIYFYGSRFYCPCCGGRFRKMQSYKDTPNAICPSCGSHMRYRFLLAYLNSTHILDGNIRLLQFAPEPQTAKFFKSKSNIEYLAGDIDPAPYATDTQKMDITNIPFSDNYFDVVVSSHVLEHVVEDEKALSEIYRTLKPGGYAILALPIYNEELEIPGLDYASREIMYGTGLHVRLNSLKSFKNKLANAKFQVNVITIDDVLGNYVDKLARTSYMDSDRHIFLCKK